MDSKLMDLLGGERNFRKEVSTLSILAYNLRHPETWPEGFTWEFNFCDSCAMGLALQLFASIADVDTWEQEDWVSWTARKFAMPYEEVERIFVTNQWATVPFFFGRFTRRVPMERITPGMVADEIDRYLARGAAS